MSLLDAYFPRDPAPPAADPPPDPGVIEGVKRYDKPRRYRRRWANKRPVTPQVADCHYTDTGDVGYTEGQD